MVLNGSKEVSSEESCGRKMVSSRVSQAAQKRPAENSGVWRWCVGDVIKWVIQGASLWVNNEICAAIGLTEASGRIELAIAALGRLWRHTRRDGSAVQCPCRRSKLLPLNSTGRHRLTPPNRRHKTAAATSHVKTMLHYATRMA